MRGVSRSPVERARVVAACKASGLSTKAFAEREHIPLTTLYHWLADHPPACPVVRIARVLRPPPASAHPPPRTSTAPPVVIQLHDARVEVAAGCDRPTLAAVLDLLDARGRQDAR